MKSRSPAPPGKKSTAGGKKSELQDLPSLSSMPDGDANYFVGGWSAEGSFTTAITRIAAETRPAERDAAAEEPMLKVAKDLDMGRFVTAIVQPETVTDFAKTNVIILPGVGQEADAATATAADGSNSATVAEVTHGMFIAGMLPSAMAATTADFVKRHPAQPAEGAGAAEGADGAEGQQGDAEQDAPRPKLRYEVTYRNPNAEEDDEMEGDEQVDEDGNPIVPMTPEEAAREVDAMRARGSAVSCHEIADYLTNVHGAVRLAEAAQRDPQRVADTRHNNAPTVAGGTGFAKPKRPTLYRKGITVVDGADLVTVKGPILFQGIRPTVAVEPEAVTAARLAAALGVATINAVDKNGKPKRKTDEEKQKEAEVTTQLEQESLEAAREEEARLNTYAMPDRWPTVYISNLAFTAPVAVKGAHLRFYRCHFSGAGSKAFLMTINQYCRVEFVECTFQQAATTALYAFPTSEVYLQDTYFTRTAMPATIDEALAFAVLHPQMSPAPATGESAVAIHADSAKLNIIRCHFEGFGNAIVYRNKFNVLGRGDEEDAAASGADGEKYGVSSEPTEEGHLPVRLRPTLSNITESTFINNIASSVSFIDAKRVGVSKCYFNDEACGGYYAVQAMGTSTPQVLRCQIYGRVLIGEGAKPFLHKNIGKVQVVDKNNKEAAYMSPTY